MFTADNLRLEKSQRFIRLPVTIRDATGTYVSHLCKQIWTCSFTGTQSDSNTSSTTLRPLQRRRSSRSLLFTGRYSMIPNTSSVGSSAMSRLTRESRVQQYV